MITFPNCKINLGLNVVSKRDDGFHNLVSCFYPIPWNDILEIVPSSELQLHLSGNPVEGAQENNLVMKAYELIKKDFDIPALEIFLHKIIPSGAGLGGGSADGAFMLRLLNSRFQLGISNQKLQDYALQLGSDCPFFIENSPVVASGRGNIFDSAAVNLGGYYIFIVKPDVHISTKEAYSMIKPEEVKIDLKAVVEKMDFKEWKEQLKNDFEGPILTKFSKLRDVKELLERNGSLYSSMSGSGSAIYGIFENEVSFPELELKYDHWKGALPLLT